MKKENGFGYIEEMKREIKSDRRAYRKLRRKLLLEEIANWSIVIIGGLLFAYILFITFN